MREALCDAVKLRSEGTERRGACSAAGKRWQPRPAALAQYSPPSARATRSRQPAQCHTGTATSTLALADRRRSSISTGRLATASASAATAWAIALSCKPDR